MKSWKTSQLKKLAQTFLAIDSQRDMENFLRDIATTEELDALASRWEVAQLIHSGMSYRDIAKKTHVSTTTITRIAHWIHHGEGGYTSALSKTPSST